MLSTNSIAERKSDLVDIRNEVRKILQKELKPFVEEDEKSGQFNSKCLKILGSMGLAAPILPRPWGQNDYLAQVIIAEEMGRVSCGFGLSLLASTQLFGLNIAKWGSKDQKEKYLPQISSGEKIGCWALTEPDIGSNAIGIKTHCKKDGDHYVLNGTKTFITNAPIADYFIVLCRDKTTGMPQQESFEGGTAFILERGAPGLETSNPFKKLGHRSSPTGQVFLKNHKVSRKRILGAPAKAFYDMKDSLDSERVIFSGLAIGLMEACVELMVTYGQERSQFGAPILSNQSYQFKIAESSAKINLLKTTLYDLAYRLETGEKLTLETASLKLLGSQFCMQVALETVQCLGGNGYMEEYPAERYMRDAKLFEIGGGTSEIQSMIIAKETINKIRKSYQGK